MPRPTHLPDIRDLTDDTTTDWWARVRLLAGVLFVCVSLATVVLGAITVWDFRRGSPFPPLVHGTVAGLLVAAPVATALFAARRHGRDFVPLVAVIAPVVVWLLVCCFLIVVQGIQGWRG